MKKLICSVVALILAMTMVAGCAGNGRSPSDKDDEKESSATTQSSLNDSTGSSANKPIFPWGDDKIPEGLSGKDVAKLLLANERLNAGLLKNEGDIFEKGEKVFKDLGKLAAQNLEESAATLVATPLKYKELTPVESLAKTTIKHPYGGTVEIDGNSYRWSDFKESNNSYEAFEETTQAIIEAAEAGALLINNIKKNVRVVDKWVKSGNDMFYLHVEENSETLYQWVYDRYEICKRYKNEDGNDVYELYLGSEEFVQRMTYIPGERYELSMYHPNIERSGTFTVADRSKGYWEVYWVGEAPEHYNVSYFVMKDDVCFDSFYDPRTGQIQMLKVMSADRKTDIMNVNDLTWVDLKIAGFDGVSYAEVIAEPHEVSQGDPGVTGDEHPYKIINLGAVGEGDDPAVIPAVSPILYLENGKTIKKGDTFVDGKISIDTIRVLYFSLSSYTCEVSLMLQPETRDEQLNLIKSFIEEVGLTCRRDLNETFAGVGIAYSELAIITQYYKWNGVSVATEAGVAKATELEYKKISDFGSMLNDVKNAEVIDINDTEKLELNILFADITEHTDENVRYENMSVSVGDISLTIEDTTLYVEDEPYSVAFALVSTDGSGGLIHIESDNEDATKYSKEKKFTVGASDVTLEIPTVKPGEYTLVAYIATSDGIRSSKYFEVSLDEISSEVQKLENIEVSAEKRSDGTLALTYAAAIDVTTELVSSTPFDYEGFKQIFAEETNLYGTPKADVIEILGENGEYVALSGNETEIANGQYRMAYNISNGEYTLDGYVYLTYRYEAPASEEDTPVEEDTNVPEDTTMVEDTGTNQS